MYSYVIANFWVFVKGTLTDLAVTDELLRNHFGSLYLLVEPADIADELFQAGQMSDVDHDAVTCNYRRYQRLKDLLAILSENSQLYTYFGNILQSSRYSTALNTLKMNEPFNLEMCKYSSFLYFFTSFKKSLLGIFPMYFPCS